MIPRSEVAVLKGDGWFLVFGRRKTGKTFMVRRMLDHDYYFFIMKGGVAAHDGELLPYPVFRERLSGLMKELVTVVVDEFQRLPSGFLNCCTSSAPSREQSSS